MCCRIERGLTDIETEKSLRLLHLYDDLISGDGISKKDAATRFGVNERSIQRDISVLRNFFARQSPPAEINYFPKEGRYRLIKKCSPFFSCGEIMNVLALNKEQHEWMLSLKALKVQTDFNAEKDEKKAMAKTKWFTQWLDIERSAFMEHFAVDSCSIAQTPYELCQRSQKLLSEGSEIKTWYYLSVVEAERFEPYGPLYGEEGKEKNKPFKGLKFKSDDFVKQFIAMDARIPQTFVDQVRKTYRDAIARMDGRFAKIALGVLSTVAISAATAATAGALAGPIAVALVGSNFSFGGAALTSASLALLGGGSIAAGGLGMAGGVATVVGGGALLGLAVGGTASAMITGLVIASPKLTLSTAAKLEVTIREVLLNSQKDTLYPLNHRLRSLAHDPLFGALFALLDLYMGTTICINNDGQLVMLLSPKGRADEKAPLFLLYYLGHLISDVFTSCGLPVPGWFLTQFFASEDVQSLARAAEEMYKNGMWETL